MFTSFNPKTVPAALSKPVAGAFGAGGSSFFVLADVFNAALVAVLAVTFVDAVLAPVFVSVFLRFTVTD